MIFILTERMQLKTEFPHCTSSHNGVKCQKNASFVASVCVDRNFNHSGKNMEE